MASKGHYFESKEFLHQVQNFHDQFARQPSEQIKEANKLHTLCTQIILDELKKQGICVRIDYTGSTYEGTKVAKSPGNNDLEFDLMIIIDCRGSTIEVESLPDMPGFAKLKISRGEGKVVFGEVDDKGYLNAERTARKFLGVMQKIVDGSTSLKENVKLRSHGPATQMDVYKPNSKDLFYLVDFVPTYETNNKERYVAKPIKGYQIPDPLAWRRSFSIEEKDKLRNADSDNGCRKKVLRTLKVIRNKEPAVNQLTSYHLKTALFLEMNNRKLDWKEDNFGQRLMGVISQLEKRLKEGNLPHFFLEGVNLLQPMQQVSISNMTQRLKRFKNSKTKMNGVLKVK